MKSSSNKKFVDKQMSLTNNNLKHNFKKDKLQTTKVTKFAADAHASEVKVNGVKVGFDKAVSQKREPQSTSQSGVELTNKSDTSQRQQAETKQAIPSGTEMAEKQTEQATSKKKKKGSRRKAKPDGNSNWMNLCSTLHIDAKRKTKAVKRPADPEAPQTEAKKAKDEIWFDNVDEIFIEAATDKISSADAEEVKSSKPKVPMSSGTETEAKLVKPDSFPGLTSCVAMDCEMVGIGPEGDESMLARVSIVNHFGVCLYDKFVLPREQVTDYRTFVSGITKENLATGEEFSKVQKEVSDILKGRTLVGHAVHNDLRVLFLTHPHGDTRDTSQYKPFRELFNGRIPALKKLSDKLLGVSVQEGQHSSVQDAQATMRLYTMYRQRWEKELKARVNQAKWKKKKKKKKQTIGKT
ncbi:RNA exonuclease 4 [Aplysia californica]|uniref:RNA exonuclease 4 n=1 Tax=Aplysia californica TaxID=6500 RepID=A0ABM0ZUB2_APLCA|nr:RNA exonuclease 4 [Aplysia californica]XP_012934623.1 RNA exonuclease 4 [Aplysia californica]